MAITISGSGIVEANLADNAVTLAKMASGTDGQIITYDASGDPAAVGPGTDGQVLTSTGSTTPPAFEAAAAGGKVLQFVTGSSGSDTTISSSGHSYTNNYVTIAPTLASSKVLILLDLAWNTEDGDAYSHTVKISDDDGSTYDWLSGTNNGYANNMAGGGLVSYYTTEHHTILLSPATTSSKTFKVYVNKYNATGITYNGYGNTRIYALEIGV